MWVHSREESLSFHSKYILNQEYCTRIFTFIFSTAYPRFGVRVHSQSKHILSGGVVLQLGPCAYACIYARAIFNTSLQKLFS